MTNSAPRAPEPDAARIAARILLVEDSPSDRRIIVEMLADLGLARGSVTAVGTLAEARAALVKANLAGADPDCILLDLSLPDSVGLGGVTVLSSDAPDTSIVVITGRSEDSLVYAAMAEGADEWICKANLEPTVLADAVRRAGERRRGRARRGRARRKLGQAQAALVLDAIEAPTASLDASGRILAVNRAWRQASEEGGGTPADTGVGVNYLTMCDLAVGEGAEYAAAAAAGIRSVLSGQAERFAMDYPCQTPTGERWYSLRVTPVGDPPTGVVATHLEITALKEVERGLQAQDARLIGALGEASPIFTLIGADGIVQHVSETTTAALGAQPGDRLDALIAEKVSASDRAQAKETMARVLASPGSKERFSISARDTRGRWRDLDLTAVNLFDDPAVRAVVITGSDVTEGRRHQIARRIESRVMQRLPAAVMVTDARGVVVYWNDRAAQMYGIPTEEAIGRPVVELIVPPPGAPTLETIVRAVTTSGRWEGDYDTLRADGAIVPTHATLEQVDDPTIGFHGIIAAAIDISERRQLEENLAFQALHDPLTGLANRRLFVDHVELALTRATRTGRYAAVLFIDIDDFKTVNDRLGHPVGDAVLRQVGERISSTLRASDVVARLGGDEFVVCCQDLADPSEVYPVAQRIMQAVSAELAVEDRPIDLSASVGVALSGREIGAEALIRNADAAMYAAKVAGKRRVELFDDATHEKVRERHELAADLARALDSGEIRTFYQPYIRLDTRTLAGFESLARWTHPLRGPISPAEFIPLAEETGLINNLGQRILQDACTAMATWLKATPGRPLKVTVNVSGRQLSDPSFAAKVRAVITETRIPPESLCLEVTESALIDAAVGAAALADLKSIGIELAIDDFGTGYSSLTRLTEFPLDYLKIDRSFVDGVVDRPEDAVIVSAVIGLANALGLRTIAEGIEDDPQLNKITGMGCDMGQGFYWSRAVPLEEATAIAAATGPLPRARSPRRRGTRPAAVGERREVGLTA